MIRYYKEVDQGSDEWHAMRRGILTASEIKLVITQTGKPASNEKERGLVFDLLAQRITGHTEPSYISDDMLRGYDDEIEARALYSEHYAPVTECGFVKRHEFGVTVGYSPDGLVGDDGLIECKSRRAKFQIQTILADAVPDEFVWQCQCALYVTRRKWLDFVSYSGGLPMFVKRVLPDEEMQSQIVSVAIEVERRLNEYKRAYDTRIVGLIPTERTVEQEITI